MAHVDDFWKKVIRMGALNVIAAAIVCGSLVLTSAHPQSSRATAGQASKFDVVSIRRGPPGTVESFTTNITTNGYRVRGQSLYSTIMVAYSREPWSSWSRERFSGAPAWVMNDLYDIEAKVADEDVSAWQKQGNSPDQTEMLHAMLQTALAERCALKLHQVSSEDAGFALLVEKHGIKFQEAKANVPTTGMPLPDGGKMVSGRMQLEFYSASMPTFVKALTMMSGGANGMPRIQDRTGLTGKYDFVLHRKDAGSDVADLSPTPWDLDEIGLTLKTAKAEVQKIVIDHVERPSEN